MAVTDEKMKKFESAVMKQADDEVKRILADLDEQKKKALSDTMDAELARHFEHMQNELAQIKQSCIKRVSLETQKANRELLLKRGEICEKVFENVKNRLVDFTGTPEYADYLEAALKKAEKYDAGDLTVCLNGRDMKFKDTVFKGMALERDEKIKIGGFILKSREKGFALDETLDARLLAQREYFSTISGLTL